MATCPECDGEGFIITCIDDLCVGGHHCIHGDGEEMRPLCFGEGEIDDYEDDYGGGQDVVEVGYTRDGKQILWRAFCDVA